MTITRPGQQPTRLTKPVDRDAPRSSTGGPADNAWQDDGRLYYGIDRGDFDGDLLVFVDVLDFEGHGEGPLDLAALQHEMQERTRWANLTRPGGLLGPREESIRHTLRGLL